MNLNPNGKSRMKPTGKSRFDQDIFRKVGELIADNYELVDVVIGVPLLP